MRFLWLTLKNLSFKLHQKSNFYNYPQKSQTTRFFNSLLNSPKFFQANSTQAAAKTWISKSHAWPLMLVVSNTSSHQQWNLPTWRQSLSLPMICHHQWVGGIKDCWPLRVKDKEVSSGFLEGKKILIEMLISKGQNF